MATPSRPCGKRGCPHLKPCPTHTEGYRDTKTDDQRRFYSSHRWRVLSEQHRMREPLCRMCLAAKRLMVGALTDHIVPINGGGDPWDERNLQTLCNACHDGKRQHERG